MLKMELNKVHHIDFLDNTLPDKCANLIIADPPYYQVKGEFDFIWKNFDDYLKDVEKWAIECKRLLADNGTLFWYGSSKRIAYAQMILDKHFNLINNLVWNKGSFMGLEESEGLRSFAPCTERILMYSNEIERTGLEEIKLDVNNFKPLRDYFEYVQKSLKLPKKVFLDKVGQCADHCFRWKSTQWDLPTKSTYDQLIEIFRIDLLEGFKTYEELRKEYEELRKEYEELRRPFNNRFKLQEVLNFSNEQSKTGAKYDHDTVKPEKLTRIFITTCSRKNDLVVVPFTGSGTECAMSAKEGRQFVGFDVKKTYVDMSNKRCEAIIKQPQLFA
jgi:site-specific DNA-methyltransferase (adenine-specific)